MSKPSTPNRSKLKGATLHASTAKQPDFGFVFIGLYLLIHFIPNLKSVDVIGPQWLFLSLLNLVVLLFLIIRKKKYIRAVKQVINSGIGKVYSLLLVWGFVSYFFAFNAAEGLISLARMFNTLITFFNISILLYSNLSEFKSIVYFLAIILFIESFLVLKTFFTGLYSIEYDELVRSLKGNLGNKNIMAAVLVMKIPFLLFIAYQKKSWQRIVFLVILTLAILAIIFIYARTSYLSLLAVTIVFILFLVVNKYSNQTLKVRAIDSYIVLLPLLISVIISQFVVSNIQSISDQSKTLGSVADRLKSIEVSESGSSSRLGWWKSSIDFIISNPLFGGGPGNWKILSIPYSKETTNELIVPYHVHNDFLEISAELGIPGGILFFLLFVFAFIYVFRTWFSNVSFNIKCVSIFSSFALLVYFFDAFLNFPAERPATQILFALILASITAAYLSKDGQQNESTKKWLFSAYIYTALVLLVPATYISYLTYKSMKGQMILMRETNSEAKEPLENIANIFPPIPNISVTTLPLQSMKARYYMRDKRYDEAIKLLDEGSKANPYIYYSEFLKAALYFSIDKMDSAYKYGKMSFYNWPRASNYFSNYVAILGRLKDTAEIKNAFSTYVKYRNEAFAWNTYLMGMLQSRGRGNPQLLMMADSALKLFPADSNLIQRRKEILGTFSTSGAAVTEDLVKQANVFYQEGAQLFAKQSYAAAAQKFIKAASLTPGNYAFYENAGLCYYANRQFDKAVQQFDKAIALGTSTTGKSEYFKGVSLVNMGKKEEGCAYVNTAKARNYPDADIFLKSNCK